jgi:hypothetical protein
MIKRLLALILVSCLTASAADIDVYQPTGSKKKVTPTGVSISAAGVFGLASGIQMPNAGFIADANGNELIIFNTTASAVNEFTFANAATGNAPSITMSGGNATIGLNIVPKNNGTVTVSGGIATTSSNVISAGGNITAGANVGSGSGINIATHGWIVGAGTDILKFWNTTFNGAPLLRLGGDTTSFPAIKRSGTTVAIRLADDSADAPFTASTVGATTSATIGGGSAITLSRTGTTTWDPASLANGASEKKTAVTVTGAAVGDPVIASLTTIVSSDWAVQACVTSANTAEVKITNNTGGVVDLASGTLRVNLLKY